MQGLQPALRLQLDAAIGVIAHPTAQAKLARASLGGGSVAHPLHLPEHLQPPALLCRPLAVVLVGWEKAALGGRGAAGALDPARREGIAGQPAQWR